MNNESGLTPLGKALSGLLIAALIGLGVFVITKRKSPSGGGGDSTTGGGGKEASGEVQGVVEAQDGPPTLSPAEPYRMKDNVLDIDISEYPGYAGLLAANGGAEPSENSWFFKNHGFKVRVKFSTEESWDALNSGKVGASVTTTDVLAVLGKQFQVVCPMLLGYSRGADGIVVQSEIKRLNSLQGKRVACGQFTETDFFIRYLAQEAGMGIQMLPSLDAPVNPEAINLVYTEDGEVAADVFLAELSGAARLAGCVTWAPKTTEAVDKSGGKARMLTTNRNLLIISDILVVNKSFAQENAKVVAGLVEGWLEGNRMVRENAPGAVSTVAKSFKWTPEQAKAELDKVHLANLPENLAYFSGAINSAGSFGGIYQSAVLAYGSLLPDAPPYERFIDQTHLQAIQQAGKFAEQKISLAPIRSGGASALESDPLLTKDIRFYFEPNSAELILNVAQSEGKANQAALDDVSRLLRVSPGSVLMLVGHVDDSKVKEFQREGAAMLQRMRLEAVQLSKNRAEGVRKALQEKFQADAARLQTDGKGWDRPVSKTDPGKNRRVEVQWYTLE